MTEQTGSGLSRRALIETGAAAGLGAALSLSPHDARADSIGDDAAPCTQREVAYICNSYGDTISVFDVARERVIHTIAMDFGTPRTISRWPSGQVTVANTPMNARLSPDKSQLWVPNSVGKNMAVVDVRTREIVRTINLPMGPCDMDFTPDGNVLMTFIGEATNDQGALALLDVATGELITQNMIGTQPEELQLTADGKRAFAVSKSVWVWNVEEKRVEAELHTPHRCYDSLLSPDNTKLYVGALWDADKLLVFDNNPDPRQIRVSATIDVDVPCSMAFTADAQHMFVTSAAKNTIHVVDLTTNRVVNSAPLPGMPSYIALNQRGDRLFACHSGGQAITVVETSTLRALGDIQTGEGPSSITMGVL